MSRNENEDISHLNLPDSKVADVIYIMRNSVEITKEQWEQMDPQPPVYAKAVKSLRTGSHDYYVLINKHNRMCDPDNTDPYYKTRGLWKFRKVSASTYRKYTAFLKQHYKSLLLQAERGL
jgi:hypothetical protein